MAQFSTTKAPLQKVYRDSFAGGVNSYLGVRQIKDEESPDMTNCDFIGKGGIGNRIGYTEIGSPSANYASGIKGLGQLKTSSTSKLIKFTSDGSKVILEHSTDGGAWTQTAQSANNVNMDVIQAGSKLFTGNGVNLMREWDGTNWADTTNGTIGKYPTYYNKQLWVVDETNADTLNFSGLYATASSKLGDFTYHSATNTAAGTATFKPGSGQEITGLKVFKDALYVFLRDSIYKAEPTTTPNVFTITQVTNSVGCVSHRSICQVEEDLYFASDDGIYALGEVQNYVSVRTTNKSAKIQQVFNNLTAAKKKLLVGEYYNFKYHLFYSLNSDNNDSCVAYDIRYGGWVDWRNMPANDATVYEDSTGDKQLYFGHPTNSEVYKMYTGNNDNGFDITSTWYSKSFDEGIPDITKIYFDHTFTFGSLNGTANIAVIFNDNEITGSGDASQTSPQGGFGRDAFGSISFGGGSYEDAVWASSHTYKGGQVVFPTVDNNYSYYVSGVSSSFSISAYGGASGTTEPTWPTSGTVTDNKITWTTMTERSRNTSPIINVGLPLRIRAKGQKFAVQYRITSTGSWRLDNISTTFIPLDHYKFPSNLKL